MLARARARARVRWVYCRRRRAGEWERLDPTMKSCCRPVRVLHVPLHSSVLNTIYLNHEFGALNLMILETSGRVFRACSHMGVGVGAGAGTEVR